MSRESPRSRGAAASCRSRVSPRARTASAIGPNTSSGYELPVPVVAAVHGAAFGGGFQLALGADLRYVAPGTLLSIVETKWGVVPDMAGTQLMRHLARKDVVRELTYTARIFSADEALAYGFATRLVEDPRAAAMSTARDIAARSPDAEATEQQRLIGRPNQIEAVKANLENRLSSFANA